MASRRSAIRMPSFVEFRMASKRSRTVVTVWKSRAFSIATPTVAAIRISRLASSSVNTPSRLLSNSMTPIVRPFTTIGTHKMVCTS